MTDGATLFRGFLEANGITKLVAARALGVSEPSAHDWAKGTKRPGAHHRAVIATWTKGEVPADSWLLEAERVAMASVQPFEAEPLEDPAVTDEGEGPTLGTGPLSGLAAG